MRGAFVVRLRRETAPAAGKFEGWVEEVDSGKELRFHSAGELLSFMGQRFAIAFQSMKKESGSGNFAEGQEL